MARNFKECCTNAIKKACKNPENNALKIASKALSALAFSVSQLNTKPRIVSGRSSVQIRYPAPFLWCCGCHFHHLPTQNLQKFSESKKPNFQSLAKLPQLLALLFALTISSACTTPMMAQATDINSQVNNTIQYEYYNSNTPRPIQEIETTKRGNCTDIAAYKQHLLTKAGITSYKVKGTTLDDQQHAVVMFYEGGERWFLDNRYRFPTQKVFKRWFYNIDTKEILR